jgi:hypothetical protein
MSNAEWITDRLPTEADGDRDGNVWMRHVSGSEYNFFAPWSHVGPGAPWQRTIYWKPPTETDRIAALEQRVAELEAMVRPSAEPPAERLRLPIDHCIRLDRACLGD